MLGSQLEADVEAIADTLTDLHPDDLFVGSVEGKSPQEHLRHRKHPFPHCHTFVSLSVAVSWCPDHRERLVGLVSGAIATPRLPMYTIAERKHGTLWVSVLDLAISVDTAGYHVEEAEEGGDDDDAPFVSGNTVEKRLYKADAHLQRDTTGRRPGMVSPHQEGLRSFCQRRMATHQTSVSLGCCAIRRRARRQRRTHPHPDECKEDTTAQPTPRVHDFLPSPWA